MAKVLIRTGMVLLGLVVLVLVFGWLVLAAPFFSELRKSTTERILSDQIGQDLIVHDDVRVVVGPISLVHVSGVEIPSENIDGLALAELKLLTIDVDTLGLLRGELDLDNLKIDGLKVAIITEPDGTTSWTKTDEKFFEEEQPEKDTAETEDETGEGGLLTFLSRRTAEVTEIGLVIDNRISGFSFDFLLDSFRLDQMTDKPGVTVTSLGSVNDQVFEIDGKYPRSAPFTTHATFGEVDLRFDGRPLSVADGDGFEAQLTLDTGSIGALMDILRLNRVIEGNGKLSVGLLSQQGSLKLSDLDAVVTLEGGQEIRVVGSVEDVRGPVGVDISIDGRMHPEGKPPAPATELKDLKLAGFDAHIVSEEKGLRFAALNFDTNGFDQGVNKVGPVKIGRIYRSPEGMLVLEDLDFQAGPEGDPYIHATGNIHNLLQFKQLEMKGTLAAPATLVLKDMPDDVARAFGGVEAEFEIDDKQGHLSLIRLDVQTVDTEIWALDVHAEMGDLTSLSGLDSSIGLAILDTASFLSTLGLDPVDAGALEVDMYLRGNKDAVEAGLGLGAGETRLDADLKTELTEGRPDVDGRIHSKRLDLADIELALAALKEIGELGEDTQDEDIKPLVLEKEEDATGEEIKPLVLPEEEASPGDLLDLEKLLLETNLDVSVEIEEIVGQKGVSSLSSSFTANEGKADLGPIEVHLAGGYINVKAAMDLVETPEQVTVSGAASGWDLGAILKKAGVNIEARGKISGRFNVTGNYSSGKAFMNSMSGSATLAMTNGAVATSLLELAGLGIFPWLFSQELQQGYTDIVCVNAPVRVSGGKASFDAVVVETESVQLVTVGSVDWKNDQIGIRAEPRKVGKPLSRSAWPFSVEGKLSAPEFKLDVGGSRGTGEGHVPADRKPCVPDALQLE